jgi:hypothetical protein
MQREYRSRIYAKYGKNFQDADGTFDERQARVWGKTYRHYFFNPNALSRLMRLSGFGATEARETGPVPFGYSVSSTLRNIVWQTIRTGLQVWNLAETGSKGSGIFTRVFIITGIKS